MLFALVMWDVLFLPIEGAFETPYQRAPLDLGTDAFAIGKSSSSTLIYLHPSIH